MDKECYPPSVLAEEVWTGVTPSQVRQWKGLIGPPSELEEKKVEVTVETKVVAEDG